MSTARMSRGQVAVAFLESRFMSSIACANRPSALPRTPVPSNPSTITAAVATVFHAAPHAAESPITVSGALLSLHRRRFSPASPFISSSRPKRNTAASAPAVFKCRAATSPSPPLFPLPHSTATRTPTGSPSSRITASATRLPAASINFWLGTPKRSVVRRSTSRISAAVRALIQATPTAPR